MSNSQNSQIDDLRTQGLDLIKANRLAAAKEAFSKICSLAPNDVDAWHTLSIINGRLGDIDEAGECCRQVLSLQPDHGEALINLGHVLFHHGRYDEAIAQYEKALEVNPRSIPALNNFALACQSSDHFQRYERYYRKAISLIDDPSEARTMFVSVRKDRPLAEYDSWLDGELQKYYALTGVDYRLSASFTARLLRLKYDIQPHMDCDGEALSRMIERAADDKLLFQFLEKTLNTDEVMEALLTMLRRALLFKYHKERPVDEGFIGLISALAFQCLNNEYVFTLDTEERQLAEILREDIERTAASYHRPDRNLESGLLVVAMYEPLNALLCREHLSHMPRTAWSDTFHRFMKRAIIEPLEEEAIKSNIVRISEVEDSTSQLVQSQYEENPYPRWVSIQARRKRNLGVVLKQFFPQFSPPEFLNGPIRVLIAGCGTGRHAIQAASYYANAEVLAVDISINSLAYASRMARKYDMHDIQFMQADILQLSKLDARFHIIEASGVLHHMEEPLKAWKVLTDLLVENGLMYIGLYSEKARKEIAAARAIIKHDNIRPDTSSIRNFRARILRRELGESLYAWMSRHHDFYSTSGCRDLLFHFKEHRFTVPQISSAIDALNLEFIGFVFDQPETAKLYHAQFPEESNMKNLLLWDKFESRYPNTFGNMYQFWCQRQPIA